MQDIYIFWGGYWPFETPCLPSTLASFADLARPPLTSLNHVAVGWALGNLVYAGGAGVGAVDGHGAARLGFG